MQGVFKYSFYTVVLNFDAEGKAAYAWKQANVRRRLILRAVAEWNGLSERLTAMEGQDADVLVKSRHVQIL